MALLGEYLNAQTYRGGMNWVVVDDCDPVTRIPRTRAGIEVIQVRPTWRWQRGMNTQADCLSEGLLHVPEDAELLILEDDDIYLPRYIDTMREALQRDELVGEKDSRYYNVQSCKWRILPGKFHASLCATACRGEALAYFRELCASGIERMIDFTLWKQYRGSKRLLPDHNVVGIKGLPGRPGIGVGHKNHFGSIDIDDKLRLWASDYADNYRVFRSVA